MDQLDLAVSVLAAVLIVAIGVATHVLPAERWQVLASIPVRRDVAGVWHGLNVTWYGVIVATATSFAAALFLVLGVASGQSLTTLLGLLAAILAIAFVAASRVARLVEKRNATLTVAGGSFVALLSSPLLFAWFGQGEGAALALGAAAGIGSLFGEGIGRLACLSFGCCYGRPLQQFRPSLRRWLVPLGVIFQGDTKKISYAAGLAGEPVLAIQTVTAALSSVAGCVALNLFLHGYIRAALVIALGFNFVWRLISEPLRSDHRGSARFTDYQWMSVIGCVFTLLMACFLPSSPTDELALLRGLGTLWHPGALVVLQGIWLVVLVYTGFSRVTGATLSFHVHRHRI